MTRQTITTLIDDLDGGTADESVSFGLDGINYEVDLSTKNAAKLRKAFEPYLGVATRLGRGGVVPRGSGPRAARRRNQAIREWALANGHTVSDRGRISAEVAAAYLAAVK